MEDYLHHRRLRSFIDGAGSMAALLAAGILWFVWLWGATVPALLAGVALGVLLRRAVTEYRRRTLTSREAALRRRLGGELLLEEMLLAPPRQAHFQAALLLGERYPLTMTRVTEDGMLCQSGGDVVLVRCLPVPETVEAGVMDVLACQRACRRQGAARGVLCVTGRVGAKAEAAGEDGLVPVRLIRRETLLTLAGRACPATDAQLVALGKRRRRSRLPDALRALTRRTLAPEKAERYMLYGLALMLLYVVTGLAYYPLPGALCLTLSIACRVKRYPPETL